MTIEERLYVLELKLRHIEERSFPSDPLDRLMYSYRDMQQHKQPLYDKIAELEARLAK